MARSIRSDERENTAGLSFTAASTSSVRGQVSKSATITLGLGEYAIPSLKAFTGIAVLIGNEMNSMPTLGSSMSALVTMGSISGEKPAVVSSGLPKLPYDGSVFLIVLSVAGSSSG